MAKSYALSKSKVREMILEKFSPEASVTVQEILDIFGSAGGSAGGFTSTLVKNSEGIVVGKKCSYFGVYMFIEQFGKRGDKYSHMSKLGDSLTRKAATVAKNEKAVLDERLADNAITVEEWKAGIASLEAVRIKITEVSEAPQYFETAEDLLAAL